TRVTFIVPVKDDAARLRRCLETIAAAGDAPYDVCVADNGSTDQSPQVASVAGATVLHLPGLRVSELRNRAAEAATGEYLAFVDADHEVAPGWLRAARSVMSEASIGAAGALYVSPPTGTWVQRMYGFLRGGNHGRDAVSR